MQVGARDADLRLKRCGLLNLNRTVNADQNLALFYPVACIHIDAGYSAALSDNADRDFAARGERARGVYRANDCVAARCHDGHGLRLSVLGIRRCGSRFAAATHHEIRCRSDSEYRYDHRSDNKAAAIALPVFNKNVAVQRAAHRCFVIHKPGPNSSIADRMWRSRY